MVGNSAQGARTKEKSYKKNEQLKGNSSEQGYDYVREHEHKHAEGHSGARGAVRAALRSKKDGGYHGSGSPFGDLY